MNRRKVAMAVITADVAENGKAGQAALRAYIENRLSYQTFQECVRLGLQIHERRKAGLKDFAPRKGD